MRDQIVREIKDLNEKISFYEEICNSNAHTYYKTACAKAIVRTKNQIAILKDELEDAKFLNSFVKAFYEEVLS